MHPHARTYARLSNLEYWLERSITLPLFGKRIGLDGLIGLIPGIGDAAGGLVGSYLLLEAWRVGVPKSKLLGMLARLAMDTGFGLIPVAGDVWDLFYAANSKNLKNIKAHLEAQGVMLPVESSPVIDGEILQRS